MWWQRPNVSSSFEMVGKMLTDPTQGVASQIMFQWSDGYAIAASKDRFSNGSKSPIHLTLKVEYRS